MPTETLAFFSSDARELYKADIYRALALPMGYVLHFRYRKKYIHRNVLQNLPSLPKTGTIFYVSGNNQDIPADKRKLDLFSIREVKIKDYEDNVNTDTIHFYLELGRFVDVTPHKDTDPSLKPLDAFVSIITVDSGPNDAWTKRVDAIKADFKNMPFFLVESVTERGRQLSPDYSPYTKSSSYHLDDESSYAIHVTLYDPHHGATGLAVENPNEEVTLAVQPGYRIGAEEDIQKFELQTHSLSRQAASAVSRLAPVNYSVLAALGLGLAKVATDDLQTTIWTRRGWIAAILGLGCIGASGGLFYTAFNKK
jgi:hypothetical protein